MRLSDRSTLVAPRWAGRAGLYFCLSTIKPQSSAVKCGQGHCGEQFMKGIVGASHHPHRIGRSTGGVGGA